MTQWLIVLGMLCSANLAAQDLAHLRSQINNIITYDSETEVEEIPHLFVGILMNGQSYFLDFGTARESQPIDSSSLFEIGDVSKLFTAQLALELNMQHKFYLDSTINFYFPTAAENNSFKNSTIEDLLNHHAGFSKYPAGIGSKEVDNTGLFANYQKADLLNYLQTINLSENKTFEYSNTGYAVLEYLMEQSMSMSYTALLQEYLFQVNALKNTFVNTRDFSSDKLLTGHNLGGQPVQRQHYASFAGSLGLISSASDLLEFMRCYWTKNKLAFEKSLEVFKKIPATKNLEIGYGWHKIVAKKKKVIFMHTGKTDGFRSYLAMVPATQTAVVVLSNSKVPQNGLGYYILKMINFGWKNKK